MNTNHSANNNLSRILNEVRVKTNPLPTSFIADKVDNHIKTTYATLMASILLHKPVGDTESRLFAMQLTALGLDADISKYFNLVLGLNTKQVVEFCQALDSADKQLTFLFDTLLLCRAGSPLQEQQLKLINEFANIWQLSKSDIALLTYWLKIILGIEFDYTKIPSLEEKLGEIKKFPNYEIDKLLKDKSLFVKNNEPLIRLVKKVEQRLTIHNNAKQDTKLADIKEESSKSEVTIVAFTDGIFVNYGYRGENPYISIMELPLYLKNWKDFISDICI